jgi:dTDP-4-amino-4,6-dideoxygalactose transaminase
LAIAGLGVGDDANVMVPALTFPGTATAVLRSGASVVLVDVDPETWCLTPEIAYHALDHARIDLVMPVAGFGRPVAAGKWDRFVSETGIPVLIDAAASFGCQQIGSRCVTAFSMHATKTLSTGEGGLVASGSSDLIEKVRQLSNFGFCGAGRVGFAGLNGKLSEYHAAVGLAQLARLDEVYERRRRVWQRYEHRLNQMANRIELQRGDDFIRSVLPVRIPGKNTAERLGVQLGVENVETRRWYCPPLNEQPAFAGSRAIGPGGGPDLPVTKELSTTILGLPFHSFLSEFEIARVCSLLSKFVEAIQTGRVRDGVA